MPDRIFLRDLRVDTIIGIYEQERVNKQTVSIDLTMPGDIRRAAASDHIDDTLNYQAVAERIATMTAASSYQLVETLAERIAAICMDEFAMPWIEVRVNKPGAVKDARDVGVHIARGAVQTPGAQDVLVALGSNVDPKRRLVAGLNALRERVGPLSRSTAYQNAAMDVDGDDFINLVAAFRTTLTPDAVRDMLREVDREVTAGSDARTAFGAHLLLYGDIIMSGGTQVLPNTPLYRYPFVLKPLAELAGHRRDPVSGAPFDELWRRADFAYHAMHPVALEDA